MSDVFLPGDPRCPVPGCAVRNLPSDAVLCDAHAERVPRLHRTRLTKAQRALRTAQSKPVRQRLAAHREFQIAAGHAVAWAERSC